MEDYEKPLTEDEEALQDTDDDSLETIDESELADDEYIEEEADVEDVANSNKALLNALIHTLAQKGIINEEELLEKASSDDVPDYSVEEDEPEEDLEEIEE